MVDGFVKDPSKPAADRKKVISSHVHHRTEKARTLMRGGLKKPVMHQSPYVSHSSSRSPEREIRAKTTTKHEHVKRFGIPTPQSRAHQPKVVSGELISKKPAGSTHKAAAAPLPSMVASASHQRLERMLDQALTHADTHMEAMRYQAARHFWQRRWWSGHRRWLGLGIIFIALIAGLVFSWQKVPQLSVKAAGIRAHISPSVPTYVPNGYHMAGPAKAVSGTVDIRYASDSNTAKSYEIIEAQSNLTSMMVAQSVVPKGAPVQTSQVDGNTVYIFGHENDAAWVNNGILYTIKDHAGLSSDELIKIVQGLN